MPSVSSQSESGGVASRKPSVRIAGRRSIPRATVLSLALATIAALSFPAVWRLLQSKDELRAPQRQLAEVEMEWKCSQGHTFRAAGQIGPRPCWHCDREAYPVTLYACPVHGSTEVLVRFMLGEDGSASVQAIRLQNQPWATPEQGLTCPRCSRKLSYVGNDPLEAVKRGQRKP